MKTDKHGYCRKGSLAPSGPKRLFHIALALCIWCFVPLGLSAADYPSWWSARGVITNALVTNDFAAATAGQVKWFAAKAKEEMDARLTFGSIGAGPAVSNLVASFTASNNYVAVNVGQLKNVATPFYDRLIAIGYTNAYPWSAPGTNNFNYALVNIGQVKNVFNFDLSVFAANIDTDGDGLPDWVETGKGIFISMYNTGTSPTSADTDGDGMNDATEISNRRNPNNSDTNMPVVVVDVSTNNYRWFYMP